MKFRLVIPFRCGSISFVLQNSWILIYKSAEAIFNIVFKNWPQKWKVIEIDRFQKLVVRILSRESLKVESEAISTMWATLRRRTSARAAQQRENRVAGRRGQRSKKVDVSTWRRAEGTPAVDPFDRRAIAPAEFPRCGISVPGRREEQGPDGPWASPFDRPNDKCSGHKTSLKPVAAVETSLITRRALTATAYLLPGPAARNGARTD